jgi:hypothetical protein
MYTHVEAEKTLYRYQAQVHTRDALVEMLLKRMRRTTT